MMWGYGYGGGGMLIGTLVMSLWIVLLVVLAWILIRWITSKIEPSTTSGGNMPKHSAMEILCQRYARGEIDTATFDQMRERLTTSLGQDRQA